ncbi:MAG: hypothetical protein FJX67_01430 [Alphaproteobacteria bacterium]|nr:hypothetical protein [Alphaproteobacteria bacterium]
MSVDSRQIARREAEALGMTVGAWLTAAIRDAAADAAIPDTAQTVGPSSLPESDEAKDREIAQLRAEVSALHHRLANLAALETESPAPATRRIAIDRPFAAQR